VHPSGKLTNEAVGNASNFKDLQFSLLAIVLMLIGDDSGKRVGEACVKSALNLFRKLLENRNNLHLRLILLLYYYAATCFCRTTIFR
jgi:hypothetical protein